MKNEEKNGKKYDVWMPLYIGDYLADTQRLSTEQHGAYLLLLMDYWRHGAPPDDDAVLARIVGLTPTAWRKMKPVIAGFFQPEGGKFVHPRVEREMVKAAEHQARRSDKAKKAADARWHQEGPEGDAPSNAPSIPEQPAKAMLGACPLPSPSSVPKGTAAKAAGDPVKELINAGVSLLTRSGIREAQARAAIGMWRRDYADDALRVAIRDATRLNAADPKAYIIKCLKNGADQAAALYASIDRTYNKRGAGVG